MNMPPRGRPSVPPKKDKPKGLKSLPGAMLETVRSFISRLFYIISLVWKAAPALLFVMIGLCALNGVLPVFGAYISRDLLNVISELIVEYVPNTEQAIDVYAVLEPLIFLFAMYVIYMFLNKVLTKINTMVTGIAGELVVNQIKLMIIEKANTVDLSSYDDPEFYAKLENANREAGMRPIGILSATLNVISAIISAVSFVVVLATLNPWAPVLIVLAAIPGAIVNFSFRNKNFRYIRFHSKERRQMNYYSGLMVNKDRVKENKILGLGDTFIDRYKQVFAKYYRGLKRLIIKEGVVQITVSLVSVLVQCALFAYVAYSVITDKGMVGDYSLYSGALTSIAGYVSTLLTATVTIYEGTLFIDNMITFMEEEPRIVSTAKNALTPTVGVPHTIELRNVSFRYPGTDKDVLKNISLKIDSGDSIVLVGLNGAGKTTLIKLLTRLYDPTEGQILLDGHDLREYDPNKLYDMFGIIFQDFGHYAETVRDNIRFGDVGRDFTEDDVAFAARAGGAGSFIEQLPDGYDTPLTRMFEERGVELSGGQWQKLSVSRAFFKDSEILILDEPTAALDPMAEQEVFDQYAKLSAGKISIFVSHKLSSAVSASKIVVLDGGELAEVGNHEELMSRRGRYFNLFSIQAHRYTGIDYSADSEA